MKMYRFTVAALPLLFSAAAALAQSPESTIRESTDPARAAEVERRAQELRGRESMTGSSGQSQMQPSAGSERGRMMHHDDMRGHERRHGHRGMHSGHPKAAPNSGR